MPGSSFGDQAFHRALGYCVAGRRGGEPLSSLFTAAEGRGLLDCFLHLWWMFRKVRAPPEQCVGQECSGKSCHLQSGRMMEMPAPGCSLALPEPCSPWGSAAQGLYQPTAAGLDRDGSSPGLPLDHVPLQPWLSAPAIPSTLALSFSGCFLVQMPPFTLASLKIPFPPLFLQPGEQGRGSVLSSPFQPQTLPAREPGSCSAKGNCKPWGLDAASNHGITKWFVEKTLKLMQFHSLP